MSDSYQGACTLCGWEGPPRSSSLSALRDFDHHAASIAHAATQAANNPDDEANWRDHPGAPVNDEPYALCTTCGVIHDGAAWVAGIGWHDRTAAPMLHT